MKWYWVLLTIIGIAILILAINKVVKTGNLKNFLFYYSGLDTGWTGYTICRPGTCLGTRSDGSQWCSSAFCNQSTTTNVAESARSFRQLPYSNFTVRTPGNS